MKTENPYIEDTDSHRAWQRGYAAFNAGRLPAGENPYKDTAILRGLWKDGYAAAHRDHYTSEPLKDRTNIGFTGGHLADALAYSAPATHENVGDVNSNARGSGARYNSDKPKVEYIPMGVLLAAAGASPSQCDLVMSIALSVADFEKGDDCRAVIALRNLIEAGYLKDICAQFDYGAKKKYAPWNWAKGMNWSVPLACIKRHWLKLAQGEQIDDESGVSHWGAIGCNLVMLVHFVSYYREGDDRPPAVVFGKEEK